MDVEKVRRRRDAIQSIQELTYRSSSHLIQLSLDSLEKGFWFGERMWRGKLTISPHIGEGEYRLVVGIKGKKTQKPPLVFLIRVHKDYVSYRQSFKSLLRRYLDISPGVAVASSSPPGCFDLWVYIFPLQKD